MFPFIAETLNINKPNMEITLKKIKCKDIIRRFATPRRGWFRPYQIQNWAKKESGYAQYLENTYDRNCRWLAEKGELEHMREGRFCIFRYCDKKIIQPKKKSVIQKILSIFN